MLQDRQTLIGRRDRRRRVEPGIDLSVRPADHGVSARHALLSLCGSGLTVTDLGSMNGTRLNGEVLPVDDEVALAVGDCLHLGAWTTITVTAAGEKPAQTG
jgi:pSer/pThr/pTyr-binding forkhead associated (FHA) protein